MKSVDFAKMYPNLLEKAKECSNKDDFIALAESNNIAFDDISLDKAYEYLKKETHELKEDELESVAGGGKAQEKLTQKIGEKVNPSTKTGDLRVLTVEERNKLLTDGSDNIFFNEQTKTWYQLL